MKRIIAYSLIFILFSLLVTAITTFTHSTETIVIYENKSTWVLNDQLTLNGTLKINGVISFSKVVKTIDIPFTVGVNAPKLVSDGTQLGYEFKINDTLNGHHVIPKEANGGPYALMVVWYAHSNNSSEGFKFRFNADGHDMMATLHSPTYSNQVDQEVNISNNEELVRMTMFMYTPSDIGLHESWQLKRIASSNEPVNDSIRPVVLGVHWRYTQGVLGE